MTTLTSDDVYALIAFAIKNNKSALIKSLNSSGYSVAANISDDDLFNYVKIAFNQRGVNKLVEILNKVPVDKSKITESEARNLAIKYNDFNPNAKFNLGHLGQSIGDFFSGHSVTNTAPSVIVSNVKSAISPVVIISIAILGIIAIVIIARTSKATA